MLNEKKRGGDVGYEVIIIRVVRAYAHQKVPWERHSHRLGRGSGLGGERG